MRSFYDLYLADRDLVEPSWAKFFDAGKLTDGVATNGSPGGPNGYSRLPTPALDDNSLAVRVVRLVGNYRMHAHRLARVSPLSAGLRQENNVPELEIPFSASELSQEVPAAGFRAKSAYKLETLLSDLRQCYCGSIGFEFEHISENSEREWLRERIEARPFTGNFGVEQQKRILRGLINSEEFEAGLNRKYVGQTRFSAEGGDTIIPILDSIRERGPELGVAEIVFGMAHRARLNVLRNILNKPLQTILAESEDKSVTTVVGSGDVKYHMGYSLEYCTSSGQQVVLSMCPNPSHLEFVNPIVEGVARAKQDLVHDKQRACVLPILIHGDAALIGQGIVAETINMSRVPGYDTGGTIHIVFNNQIGFTTDWNESRSFRYSTDLIKVESPVFHVNAEDPEACVWAATTALEFRQRFGHDVIIDLICYRKYGHNEGDDPSFTQPEMYKEIKGKRPISAIYQERLLELGLVQASEAEAWRNELKNEFDETHNTVKNLTLAEACAVHGKIRGIAPTTSASKNHLERVAQALTELPSDFHIYPKLKQILAKRIKSLSDGSGIDWGFAENLAFGSLILDGQNVRVSGQDVGRGTFGQRHIEFTDAENGLRIRPFDRLALNHDPSNTPRFEVFNSVLSEAGVMGFEFGYATQAQSGLVCWEGQYGDFCNGGQVIIDQFIVNSEQAWGQTSGIVLLLPHGYEGQGPEHSSARLERFLQLAGEGNVSVCYPSTAAQYFHLLRRQALTPIRRPLIVMTPKSLLRSPSAASGVDDFTSGGFQRVIFERLNARGGAHTLLLMCGKIYHDLVAELKKSSDLSAEILRIEELYPFPENEILKLIKQSNAKRVIWVQEEPENMGAWTHVYMGLHREVPTLEYLGRARSASTATGSHKHHTKEQAELVQRVISTL